MKTNNLLKMLIKFCAYSLNIITLVLYLGLLSPPTLVSSQPEATDFLEICVSFSFQCRLEIPPKFYFHPNIHDIFFLTAEQTFSSALVRVNIHCFCFLQIIINLFSLICFRYFFSLYVCYALFFNFPQIF